MRLALVLYALTVSAAALMGGCAAGRLVHELRKGAIEACRCRSSACATASAARLKDLPQRYPLEKLSDKVRLAAEQETWLWNMGLDAFRRLQASYTTGSSPFRAKREALIWRLCECRNAACLEPLQNELEAIKHRVWGTDDMNASEQRAFQKTAGELIRTLKRYQDTGELGPRPREGASPNGP